jgi:hypothetical protein
MKTASLGLLEVIVVRAYFPGEGDVTALPCESSLLDMYIGRYVVRVGRGNGDSSLFSFWREESVQFCYFLAGGLMA